MGLRRVALLLASIALGFAGGAVAGTIASTMAVGEPRPASHQLDDGWRPPLLPVRADHAATHSAPLPAGAQRDGSGSAVRCQVAPTGGAQTDLTTGAVAVAATGTLGIAAASQPWAVPGTTRGPSLYFPLDNSLASAPGSLRPAVLDLQGALENAPSSSDTPFARRAESARFAHGRHGRAALLAGQSLIVPAGAIANRNAFSVSFFLRPNDAHPARPGQTAWLDSQCSSDGELVLSVDNLPVGDEADPRQGWWYVAVVARGGETWWFLTSGDGGRTSWGRVAVAEQAAHSCLALDGRLVLRADARIDELRIFDEALDLAGLLAVVGLDDAPGDAQLVCADEPEHELASAVSDDRSDVEPSDDAEEGHGTNSRNPRDDDRDGGDDRTPGPRSSEGEHEIFDDLPMDRPQYAVGAGPVVTPIAPPPNLDIGDPLLLTDTTPDPAPDPGQLLTPDSGSVAGSVEGSTLIAVIEENLHGGGEPQRGPEDEPLVLPPGTISPTDIASLDDPGGDQPGGGTAETIAQLWPGGPRPRPLVADELPPETFEAALTRLDPEQIANGAERTLPPPGELEPAVIEGSNPGDTKALIEPIPRPISTPLPFVLLLMGAILLALVGWRQSRPSFLR